MKKENININWDKLSTPCYVVDEKRLIRNLEILKYVQDTTECKILLAQKAFSMVYFYPLIKKYLTGTTASGLFEAKLAFEEMGGEVHIFSPAYTDAEFDGIMQICDCVVFNSFNQWRKFKPKIQNQKKTKKIRCGIRVNPEYSEIETEIYNPCAKNSRLGVTADKFKKEPSEVLDGISGLHFHTMCEQNSDTLWRTLEAFDKKFGKYLESGAIEWVNFGGGHHITRTDYDIETLIKSIIFIKEKFNVEIYLEPGEAVALNTGFLVSSVLEIIENETDVAILDASAACHMPDVLEMPYRPEVIGAAKAGEKQYNYRLGGPTCLAGDIIGDYSFDNPLKAGDRIIFCDMAHYTMVKNNTFNGMNLPSIAVNTVGDEIKIIKQFGYEDFKNRLS